MKIMYHGKEIDDSVEPGKKELDMLTPNEEELDKTLEYDFSSLELEENGDSIDE